MVKAYLRYDGQSSFGVIASRECNIAVDHDGSLALTGGVEVVGVWSLRQGTQVHSLALPKSSEKVTRLRIKEGKEPICAAGYSDGTVRLWNYREAQVLQTLQGHRSGVSCIAFDRSGHLLASGANDTDIVLWDVTSESGLARLRGHVDQVTAVLFWEGPSPTKDIAGEEPPSLPARLISASKDRFVRIWSIELQLCLQTIAEHKVEVWSLSLNSAQDRLVAGSADKFLRFWTLSPEASGSEDEPLATFYGAVPRPHGQGSALTLQFARPRDLDFEILLCQGSGKVLELFRCHTAAEVKKRLKRRKRRKAAKAEKNAPGHEGGQELEVDEHGDEEAHAADEIAELPPHRSAGKALSMAWCSATNTALLGLSNNSLEVVHLTPSEDDSIATAKGSQGFDQHGHRTGVRALAVAHDDSLLMSMSAEAVKIWNTTTQRCIRTMASGYGLCGLFVVGNEYVLVGTKEGNLELYDLRVAELAQSETPHAGAVYGIAQHPDHKRFSTCSADKHLRFFEFTFERGPPESCTFKELQEKATELPDEGLSAAYSPNGKWVAVALLNNTVQLMFADSLKFYLCLYGHQLPVLCVDLSSDSQMLASGSSDKNVKLWSTQFGNCHRSLRAHGESVMQVRFLPGTHYLASAGRDRELKLWDCDSYELISALRGHATEILALALSQDAAFIVTASSDRQIRFWRRSQEQLFLSEERAKELEERFEQEVEREDLQRASGGEAVTLRASRRTVESVRTTERLMELLDEASAAEEQGTLAIDGRHPCARVVGYVNTLTASSIYEVLLALPFGHALRLLQFICRFFEAVAALPKNVASPGGDAQTKALSAAATLETPCQAALITTYVHHSELAATPGARPLILRLRQHMRELLQAEKDRIGLSMAGFAHLHRALKRSGSLMSSSGGPKAIKATAKSSAASKKRKV
mmetsp:Transcript_144252/g.402015  ORF Transcript_144252/g.402015 Transcript_144252/m.402015 type:complete len:926 (-) Transcript_144252:49-2826(-)